MYETMVQKLRDEAAKCEYRAKQTEENAKKVDVLNTRIAGLEDDIEICNNVMMHTQPVLDDILRYINEKSEQGQHRINQALSLAGDIIPDSMKGIQFKIENEKAWLEVNEMNVDDVEGSGYKGAASMFIQASILQQNPQHLQTLILDEPLSKVSVENSASISACLPYICRDLQVILIEQKPEVYANFGYSWYKFFKDENGTRVEFEKKEGNEVNETG